MTEPIPKPDQHPEPPEPSNRTGLKRLVVLGTAVGALFAGIVMAVLFALPQPHTDEDYLIAGALATMVALLAFIGVLVSTFGGAEVFYKKRTK
jgi:uncharacterized membrane protein